MKPYSVAILSLFLSANVFACINPGDPRYAEILAQQHLQDFLDFLDTPPEIDESKVELLLDDLSDTHSDYSNADTSSNTLRITVPPAPSIHGVNTNNFHIDTDLQGIAKELDSNPNFWKDRANKLRESATARTPPFEVSNEYAAALIFTGDYKNAIKALKKQERLHPGKYETATNLGTAYELSGKLKSAKRWIDEGQKRNPESHGGSEWIHSAILKAKIALSKDQDWLERNYVSTAELDWSNEENRQRTRKAILIQLSERLVFVKSHSPIVSSLFFELGSIYEYEESIQNAEVFYQKSLDFGDTRKNEIEKQRHQREFKTSYLQLSKTAKSEVLREAIRIASEKPDEDCCRAVRAFGQELSEHPKGHSVEALTYQNPTFWKALIQMSPDNQLVDSILVALYVQAGDLDKARRLTSALAPFTYAQNIDPNFGTESMLKLSQELDTFYEMQSDRIQAGIQLHDKGQKEDAIRIYKTVTDVFPKSVWANWEIVLSSEQFLKDSIAKKNQETIRKIQSLDPLFMMGGTYSGSEEIGRMLLRMELSNLGSKGLSFQEHYYKYAETALLLEQYGMAAFLYWKAIPVLEHPNLSQQELIGRFLYCMEALAQDEIVSIFDSTLASEIEKTEDFVDAAYRKFESR